MARSESGKLQDVLTWERPVRTTSATGQVQVSWQTAGTQRCHVVPTTGMERTQHDQPVPQHSHRVEVRARTWPIAHDWRAVWKGAVLNVVVALPAETGDDWQVVLCQEQAPSSGD